MTLLRELCGCDVFLINVKGLGHQKKTRSDLHSLELTASLPLKIDRAPKRKGWSSNHPFSGARLVSGSVRTNKNPLIRHISGYRPSGKTHIPPWEKEKSSSKVPWEGICSSQEYFSLVKCVGFLLQTDFPHDVCDVCASTDFGSLDSDDCRITTTFFHDLRTEPLDCPERKRDLADEVLVSTP